MSRFREFISRRLSPGGNRPYSSVPLHEHSSGNSGGDLTSENTFLHVEKTGSTRRVILVLCMAFSAIGTALSTWVVVHGSGHNVHFGSQLLPIVSVSTSVEFQPDYSYWNLSDYESERSWASLGRKGDIMITNPEKYGLQPGIEKPGSDYEGFPVSVYHQLHCLKTIRTHYAALVTGRPTDDRVANHPDHCFDYLRQSILCAADMTLEKARVDPDGHRRATDGWGTVHQCKNWLDVEGVVIENRWTYVV